MKRSLLVKTLLAASTFILFRTDCLLAQSLPPYKWVKTAGGTGAEQILNLKTDGAGNLYTTGVFASSITLGSFTLTPVAGQTTGNYIAKQDASGNYLWATALPKFNNVPSDPWRVWLTVDAAGNVYSTGRFSGSLTLGSTTLTAPGTAADYSVYVAKQATDGSYLWATMVPDPGAGGNISVLYGICADATGNVYITGQFGGTVDFDGSASTADLTGTTTSSMFVLKLDNLGNYTWAKAMTPTTGNSSNAVYPQDIAVDELGNVVTTGAMFIVNLAPGEYVDFDPGPGVFQGRPTGVEPMGHFINKLDANGDHVWTKVYGNSVTPLQPRCNRVFIDSDENIYATGWFMGGGDFDPGTGTVILGGAGGWDAFILKLDASGNYSWARQISGAGNEFIRSVQLDGSGNVYLAGTFSGTIDIDPGSGVVDLTSSSTSSTFITKWDNLGNYMEAQLIDNAGGSVQVQDLVVNSTGTEVAVSGFFTGTMDFDPGAGSSLTTSAGGNDVFVLKLAPATVPITLSYFNARAKGTTAELTWATGSESNNKGFDILRSADGRSWQSIGFVSSKATGGNSANDLTYNFTDKAPLSGINYYRLKQEDFDGRTDLSLIRSLNVGNNKAISLFPNPTPDILYISGLKGGETVFVYNTAGQLQVSQQFTQSGTAPISLQKLPKGNYYIKVTGKDNSTQTFKVTLK